MIIDFVTGKCPTCENSIFCPTWGERKCPILKRRFFHNGPLECEHFKKRGKDFKESKCRCEDCLKNENLIDAGEEEE